MHSCYFLILESPEPDQASPGQPGFETSTDFQVALNGKYEHDMEDESGVPNLV